MDTQLAEIERGFADLVRGRAMNLKPYYDKLARIETCRWTGSVTELVGLLVESKGPAAAVGDFCEIGTRAGRTIRTQVIGFRDGRVLSMPLEETDGLQLGDPIVARKEDARMEAGPQLLGRVLDGFGSRWIIWGRLSAASRTIFTRRRRGRWSASRSARRWSPAFAPSTAC